MGWYLCVLLYTSKYYSCTGMPAAYKCKGCSPGLPMPAAMVAFAPRMVDAAFDVADSHDSIVWARASKFMVIRGLFVCVCERSLMLVATFTYSVVCRGFV